jgi:hypothetical protein
MKNLLKLSPCLVAGALTLVGCIEDKVLVDEGAPSETETDAGDPDVGDGDGDGNGDGDGDGEGEMFVPMLEDGGTHACDPWAQDCPSGEKCVAYSVSGGNWDANRCVAITGEGQQGDACTYSGTADSIDDCGVDSFCWNVNADGVGVCTAFCEGTPDSPACDPDQGCTIANNGSINLCLQSCDPLLQDCEEGSVCFYDFGGDFVCTFAGGEILTGGACGFINDCAPGNVCLGAEALPECDGATCCGAFCSLSDPACATVGTECSSFFEEGTAPPAYVDVGVCIIPGA